MTTVARQLPTRFTLVRAMSITASTPRIRATPSSGRPNCVSAPERITSDARGTAATPFDVSISVSIISSCVLNGISMFAACATNMLATARYSVLPSRLKLYPVGITKATIRFGTPSFSIACIAVGRAASELAVENASSADDRTCLTNAASGTRVISATGIRTTRMNTASAPYSVSTSLSRVSSTGNPDLPTVAAIAPAMPIGAKAMTIPTNLNIT